MKRVLYLIGIYALLLFTSCSNNEIAEYTPEVKTYTPIIKGNIGEFKDGNTNSATKSGVIEDNPNYANGEKFYWHNGDKAKVLFFPGGDTDATPIELIYTAVVNEGTKPNSCNFTTTGSIPAGDYAAYALYPADGWSKDETGYKATFPNGDFVFFDDASSAHLKDYMFMKADAGSITISETGDNTIDLSFRHLTSVVRFHITKEYNATTMSLGSSFMLKESNDNNFFYTRAYLNDISGMELTPTGDWSAAMILYSSNTIPFAKEGTMWEIDLFMPIFPTKVSVENKRLYFEVYIAIDETNYYQQSFGTDSGLRFDNELSFMSNGFEAGKSYYFNLKPQFGFE